MRGPAVVVGFVGSVVGAGYATGQEIHVFFSRYGADGTAAAVLATAGFALLGRRLAAFLDELPEPGLAAALQRLAGKRAAPWWEAVAASYLFASLSIMEAAGDALAAQALGWGRGLGAAVLAVLAALLLWRGTRVVQAAGGFLAAVLVTLTVTVAWHALGGFPGLAAALRSRAGPVEPAPPWLPWPLSALLYVAYNGFLGLAALSGWLPARTGGAARPAGSTDSGGGAGPARPWSRLAPWGGVAGIATGLLVLLLHLALLANLEEAAGSPVPLGTLTADSPSLFAAYGVNLTAALLVHLLVVGHGLGARVAARRPGRAGAVAVLAAFPLSLVGLAELVRTVYTGVAVVALFLLPWLWLGERGRDR